MASTRSLAAARRHSLADHALPGPLLVRHRFGDAAHLGSGTLREPLLVPADAVGERLGRAKSDCGCGLQGGRGRTGVAEIGWRRVAARGIGKGILAKCAGLVENVKVSTSPQRKQGGPLLALRAGQLTPSP